MEIILMEIETLGKKNTDKSLWIINIDLLFSMYSKDNCDSFSNWYFVDSRVASKVKYIMHFFQLVHLMCSHHLTIFLWWSTCYFSYILFQLFKCCRKQYLKQYIEKNIYKMVSGTALMQISSVLLCASSRCTSVFCINVQLLHIYS